ncbi:MAG: SUMF1/EgtB/PvdO family nonheme iron enzyme [Planctomycetes bacterium]|nr:SUMF1/EgtB/PvdO family nonheme iron enzyme [Planctomycetota bacterium]
MKRLLSTNPLRALAPVCLCAFFSPTAVWAGPTVTNVTAAQRPDQSRLVDITYDLAATGPCTVWFVVSSDGGTSWNIPAMTYTGAIGPNVSPGAAKAIVWDAGADIPGKTGSFKVRVFADDGLGTNMVLVPGGTFPYQGNVQSQIYVGPFLIDKYEVTNQRYCEYLNSADQNGDHYHPSMEITRNGTPPAVTYAVYIGKQNYPIRWVSALDAEAFAAWLSARDSRTYRLPTEQEWEKAAAWDNVQNIYWYYCFQSNSIDCTRANHHNGSVYCVGSASEVGHYNGTGGTVDSKSFFGCYDMSGNLWEWTSSDYQPGYRVNRGGAWNYSATDCQSTFRNYSTPATRNNNYGFRLVLDSN